MANFFFNHLLTLFITTAVIFGCAQHQNLQTNNILLPNKDLQLIWHDHQNSLANLNSWQFKARVQIKTKYDYAKFAVRWQQKGNNYNCNVTGPLAVSVAKITGKKNYIALTSAGQNLASTNPEVLIQEVTGCYIPLMATIDWIKGSPNADYPAEKKLNKSGQIYQLKQLGFQIQYSDYKKYKNYMLPVKINITNADISIAIIITKWAI